MRVAPHRHLEVNEDGPSRYCEISVFRQEDRDVPRLELACKHQTNDASAASRFPLPAASADHRQMQAVLTRGGDRFLVAGIGVAGDTRTRVVREHTLETNAHFRCAIRDDDLPSVEGISDAN